MYQSSLHFSKNTKEISRVLINLKTVHEYGTLEITGIPDHIILDRSPNIGTLVSLWELDKFKNC